MGTKPKPDVYMHRSVTLLPHNLGVTYVPASKHNHMTILTNLNATSFLTEKNSDKAFSSSLSPPRHSLVFEEMGFWSTKCLSMKTLLRKPTKARGEAFPLMRLSYCIQAIICKVRPKQVSQPHDYYLHAGQI